MGLGDGLRAHGPADDPFPALEVAAAAVAAQVAVRIAEFGSAGRA